VGWGWAGGWGCLWWEAEAGERAGGCERMSKSAVSAACLRARHWDKLAAGRSPRAGGTPAHLEVQPQLCEHLDLEVNQLLVQRLRLLRAADHEHLDLAKLVDAVEALAWGVGGRSGCEAAAAARGGGKRCWRGRLRDHGCLAFRGVAAHLPCPRHPPRCGSSGQRRPCGWAAPSQAGPMGVGKWAREQRHTGGDAQEAASFASRRADAAATRRHRQTPASRPPPGSPPPRPPAPPTHPPTPGPCRHRRGAPRRCR
jgi:hypothetical protein